MTRLLCCLAVLLLAACGASGGLYLPDQAPPKPSAFGSKDPRKAAPPMSPAPAVPDAAATPAETPPAVAPAAPDTPPPSAPASTATTPNP